MNTVDKAGTETLKSIYLAVEMYGRPIVVVGNGVALLPKTNMPFSDIHWSLAGGSTVYLNKEDRTDYRKLLMRYINHVGDCEGTDFLYYDQMNKNFSAEEKNILHQLSSDGIEFEKKNKKEGK